MVWTPISTSVWTAKFTSGSGQTWTIPVDVANGRLFSQSDLTAFENAVTNMAPGSQAVAHAAKDFALAEGLIMPVGDGSFVVTTQNSKLKCVLAGVGLAASYGAFATCAVGGLPLCVIGIVGHTAAVAAFANSCFGG